MKYIDNQSKINLYGNVPRRRPRWAQLMKFLFREYRIL